MNPVLMQALSADHVRELQEHAAVSRQASDALRVSRRSTRIQRVARGRKQPVLLAWLHDLAAIRGGSSSSSAAEGEAR